MSAENGKLPAPTTARKPVVPPVTIIKREPSEVLASNGLSRLTPARDLTLGGRGGGTNTKKVFTPNLNAVRNKNANVKTSKDLTVTRGRGRGGRGERGGRGGAGRGNSLLVQTTGVFSEGAGAITLRKSAYGGTASERAHEEASLAQMRKPMFTKHEKKIDSKEEAAKLRALLGDSEEEDVMEDKTETLQAPIKINPDKWMPVKKEIKCEKPDAPSLISNDSTDESIAVAQHLQSLHVQQQQTTQQDQLPGNSLYPESVNDFLNETQSQIFIMQLPDTLPCVVEEAPRDGPSVSNAEAPKEATGNNATSNNMDPPDPQTTNEPAPVNLLKKLEEGQIGKLLRYKSGKIKLVLGETRFDLEMGLETGFLQELMSVSANRSERSGNMINLGPIQAKLNATPDWEYLVSQYHKATDAAARLRQT